ncbi:DUF6265 family protein [Dyadobacter sp. CY107]|uniref:DUF6265 family protein n=1 Tax=Dyadobacter fanqingshengii TaxID=2906443 RepID=UPI001F222962|nr:DUF6265 family protein [Dyadobacter fanqingshengii]MCF2504639.1 DUF6265 family protein [Dyadobacter fanqingshengii]
MTKQAGFLTNGARKCLIVLLLASTSMIQNEGYTKSDFEKLNAIVGSWKMQRTGGDMYETWHRVSPSEFSGVSYKLENGDTVKLETVRLYLSNRRVIYAPVTFGQNDEKEVLFDLKSIQGKKFIFENPKHDFPQRIGYAFLPADSLHAYIEGTIDSKPRHIDYKYSKLK